jgi:GNAT superfamily N-acetyltransferase
MDPTGTPRIDPADAASPAAVQLLDGYFAELAARFPDGFDGSVGGAAPAAEMGPPDGTFLVAWAGEEPVACGGLRRLAAGEAELKHMWVDPAWRGRGVARRLLAALEAAAGSLGYRRIRLDTSIHLPEAVALYRRAGWIETPPYNENPYAGHWFLRELGGPGR